MRRSETFFSEAEKEQVACAVAAVEKKTSGEVVVMVVDASDTYPEAGLLAGLAIGGLTALLITDLFLADSLIFFVPLMALGLIAVCSLARVNPWLLRLFIPESRLAARVSQRALLAFYEKGLHATRERTGVLFFISLLEHKVWILADKGIYEKIPQESLQAYAKDIATGIKEGRAGSALCRQIEAVGAVLARDFPVRADDANELADQLLTG